MSNEEVRMFQRSLPIKICDSAACGTLNTRRSEREKRRRDGRSHIREKIWQIIILWPYLTLILFTLITSFMRQLDPLDADLYLNRNPNVSPLNMSDLLAHFSSSGFYINFYFSHPHLIQCLSQKTLYISIEQHIYLLQWGIIISRSMCFSTHCFA